MFFPLTLPMRFEYQEAKIFFTHFNYYMPGSEFEWDRIESPGKITLDPKIINDAKPSEDDKANLFTIEIAFSSHEVDMPAVSILLSRTEPQIFIHDENFPSDQVEKISDAVSKSLDKTVKSFKYVGKSEWIITVLLTTFILAGVLFAIYFFVYPAIILLIVGGATIVLGLVPALIVIFRRKEKTQ